MTRRDQLIDQSNRTDAIIFLGGFTILLLIVLSGLGCGSVKSTLKTRTDVTYHVATKTDSSTNKVTETKYYGDSLKAANLIPFSFWDDLDSVHRATPNAFTLTTESKGIKQTEKFTPHYNKKGRMDGLADDNETIAKPTAETDTREVQHSQVSQTTVKDSTAKVLSTTKKTIGLGLPSWVWWGAGIIALLAIGWFAVKLFLKHL